MVFGKKKGSVLLDDPKVLRKKYGPNFDPKTGHFKPDTVEAIFHQEISTSPDGMAQVRCVLGRQDSYYPQYPEYFTRPFSPYTKKQIKAMEYALARAEYEGEIPQEDYDRPKDYRRY